MQFAAFVMRRLIYVVIPPSYISVFFLTQFAVQENYRDRTPKRRYLYSMLGLSLVWEFIFYQKLNNSAFYGFWLYFLTFTMAFTTMKLARRVHHAQIKETIEPYENE